MQKYPSTQAKDKWGLIAETAMREPVTITRHGRPSLVVTSMQDYEALQRLKFEALKADIQLGIDALERGEGIDISTPEQRRAFLEDIKARGRERLRKNRKTNK